MPATTFDSDTQAEDENVLSNTTRSFEASIHLSLIRRSHRKSYQYDEKAAADANEPCGKRLLKGLKSTRFLLCTSHTLASWGNRMWAFAVGLFLIYLSQTSLRLTAIFGFVSGGAIMLFGPIMGDLVDTMERLRFARDILIMIDVSIAISAVVVCLTVAYQAQLVVLWGGWGMTCCHIVIVTFAVIANTASVGRMIAIERDWIVVMVKDKYELTALSALLRRIDLVTNLLAPVITGQLFTYGSIMITSIFIAVWNVFFVFIEYALLWIIYKRVPELALPKQIIRDEDEDEKDEKSPLLGSSIKSAKSGKSTVSHMSRRKKKDRSLAGCCKRTFSIFIMLFSGWGVYVREETVLAGMALGFAFMTVLGFDNVTTGFAIEEGISSSMFGILSGIGSLVGVVGTIAFPVMRRKIGLLKTGMFAFFLEAILLIPCVISVWVPGSLFQWDYLWAKSTTMSNINITSAPTTVAPYTATDAYLIGTTFGVLNSSDLMMPSSTVSPTPAAAGFSTTTNFSAIFQPTSPTAFPPPTSYWSVILFMFGIVTSRFGLWMADLTVTQLLIETPAEHQRGVVNGVQNAINRTWDLVKFLLVVLLPWPQTFGYLVILTFVFIVLSNFCFLAFSFKARKYGYKVLSDEKEREEQEAREAAAADKKSHYKYTDPPPVTESQKAKQRAHNNNDV